MESKQSLCKLIMLEVLSKVDHHLSFACLNDALVHTHKILNLKGMVAVKEEEEGGSGAACDVGDLLLWC
jgi:hypothetical protein